MTRSQPSSTRAMADLRSRAAKRAGTLLLLAAAANVVMVASRVLADADQPTLAESMAAIAESRVLYGTTGAARLLSGVLLAGAALFLWKSWAAPSRAGAIAAALLAASGAVTAASGACALTLASAAEASTGAVDPTIETIEYARSLTGKAGFAAAGVGLVALALRRAHPEDTHRLYPAAALIIGLAMQFIWLDAATIAHRIVGVAFFVWLLAAGAALARSSERNPSAPEDGQPANT